MIWFTSGGRISSIAFLSLFCAAVTKALLAPSGDENVFWPCCCAAERVGTQPINTIATAVILGRLAQSNLPKFGFLRRIALPSIYDFAHHLERNEPRLRMPPATANVATRSSATEAGASA